MNSKSKRCSRSCHEMLLTYSVGMESSASRQAVTAQQKESVWFPIQEDSLRLFTEFFQKASVFHFRVLQVVGLSDTRNRADNRSPAAPCPPLAARSLGDRGGISLAVRALRDHEII